MKGSTYKRCRCREDGRDLGSKCPKLRRTDGSWNPNLKIDVFPPEADRLTPSQASDDDQVVKR
jgi:hypothetical protein